MVSRANGIKPPLVFVDADVWVDWLTRGTAIHPDTGEERWRIAASVAAAILASKVRLATDTLIEAEVNCNGTVKAEDRQVRQRFSDLLRSSSTIATEVDRFLVTDAIALSERHSLRGADAVHLAAAVRLKCDYFMSYDQRFPHGIKVGGVNVVRPQMVWQPDLFEDEHLPVGDLRIQHHRQDLIEEHLAVLPAPAAPVLSDSLDGDCSR